MAKALMRKDLTGQRFGKLVAKYVDEKRSGNGKVFWICACDCGNETSVQSISLTRKTNGVKSCGCLRNSQESKAKAKLTRESYPKDITGLKFGRLTVIKQTSIKSQRSCDNGSFLWECECECGNICYYSRYSLISPRGVKSCGCYYKSSRFESNKRYNIYDLESYEYGVGYCSNNTFFLFDKEDYDKIKNYSWWYDGRYVVAHTLANDCYTTATIRMHRLVLDIPDRENINVDHINLIRFDCRKSNLRKATNSENARNQPSCFATSNNPVGIKQISDNKFSVSILKNQIGIYDTFEEAFKVRKQKEEELFGDFQYNPNAEIAF